MKRTEDGQDLSVDERAILTAAWRVRELAHAPYSRYKVGAAIKDEQGNIHAGCNVENRSLHGHARRTQRSQCFNRIGRKTN